MRFLIAVLMVVSVAACSGPSGSGSGGGSGGSGGSGTGGSAGSGTGGSAGSGTGGSAGSGTGGSAGSGTGGGTGGGTASLTLAQVCTAFATAVCDRQVRCGVTPSTAMTTCVAATAENCSGTGAVAYRAQRGLDTFDGMQAQRCVDTFATLSCQATANPPECNSVFATDAGVGAPCKVNGDCAAGFCPTSGTVTCGVCTAYVGSGSGCDLGARCDPATSFCPNTGTDGGLTDGGGQPKCLAKLADGQPCPAQNARCLAGYCHPTQPDGGALVCGPVPRGQQCDDYDENVYLPCADDDFCQGLRYVLNGATETRASYGTCTARNAIGASCTSGQFDDGCVAGGHCASGMCKASNRWDSANATECGGNRDCVGGWCRYAATWPYQPDGGALSGAAAVGQCFAPLDAGSACGIFDVCRAGNPCVGSVCTALRAPGAACSAASQCQNFLSCPDAGVTTPLTCQPGQMSGQGCGLPASLTCTSTLACQFDGGVTTRPGTCIVPGGTGTQCFGDNQCASTLCRQADGGAATLTGPGSCAAYCY